MVDTLQAQELPLSVTLVTHLDLNQMQAHVWHVVTGSHNLLLAGYWVNTQMKIVIFLKLHMELKVIDICKQKFVASSLSLVSDLTNLVQ